MKRYLLTGGAGFIGSAIAQRLINEGNEITILDNESRVSVERLKSNKANFKFIKGDIRDLKTVLDVCKNIDSVIHLAYINGTEFFYSIPEVVLEIGVKGMVNVLDACVKNKVKELILMSSSEVYADPPVIPTPENVPLVIPDAYNPRFSYAGGKIISELMTINYARKFFKQVMIVRPHNVYGPNMGREHVIPQLVLRMKNLVGQSGKKEFPIQGSGNETRAFIYIDDFVDALILLLNKGKHLETYNIGTMDEISIKNLTMLVAKTLAVSISIKPGKLQPGSPLRRCPDTTKIQNLGFKPKTSLDEGLKQTVEWYSKSL